MPRWLLLPRRVLVWHNQPVPCRLLLPGRHCDVHFQPLHCWLLLPCRLVERDRQCVPSGLLLLGGGQQRHHKRVPGRHLEQLDRLDVAGLMHVVRCGHLQHGHRLDNEHVPVVSARRIQFHSGIDVHRLPLVQHERLGRIVVHVLCRLPRHRLQRHDTELHWCVLYSGTRKGVGVQRTAAEPRPAPGAGAARARNTFLMFTIFATTLLAACLVALVSAPAFCDSFSWGFGLHSVCSVHRESVQHCGLDDMHGLPDRFDQQLRRIVVRLQ